MTSIHPYVQRDKFAARPPGHLFMFELISVVTNEIGSPHSYSSEERVYVCPRGLAHSRNPLIRFEK